MLITVHNLVLFVVLESLSEIILQEHVLIVVPQAHCLCRKRIFVLDIARLDTSPTTPLNFVWMSAQAYTMAILQLDHVSFLAH